MIQYYVLTDEWGRLIAHSSDLALASEQIKNDGWIPIPAPVEGLLFSDEAVPLYSYIKGEIARRSPADIRADRPQREPDVINLLKAQLKAEAERSDFLEDCLAEMAQKVYG